MKYLNKVDRPLLTAVPALKKLSAQELMTAMEDGILVVDARNKADFANGFIPGSFNIQGNNSFATWAGWYLSYDKPFILLAPENQHDDLVRKLMRIGLDKILGYIESVDVYTAEGGKLEQVSLLSLDEFKKAVDTGSHQIVDLRGESEFKSGHVSGADHVFIGTLPQNLDKISKDRPVAIHCQGGDRATIGYSILAKAGFTNISNYSPGMNEWMSKGLPVEA